MSAENDRALAEAVKHAAADLNKATHDAAKAGLRVEIKTFEYIALDGRLPIVSAELWRTIE